MTPKSRKGTFQHKMDKDLGNTPAKKLQEGNPAFDEHDIDNRHRLEYPKTKEAIPIKTPRDGIDCENYRPQHHRRQKSALRWSKYRRQHHRRRR